MTSTMTMTSTTTTTTTFVGASVTAGFVFSPVLSCLSCRMSERSEEITALCASVDGATLCSAATDQTAKIYDVKNFDMINIFTLGFEPLTAEFICVADSPKSLLAM